MAEAYSYESPIGVGCHERITARALRPLRDRWIEAGPFAATHQDRVLVDDLPFDVPSDMRDIGAATLLVGVRDNDLHGRSGIDSSDLAHVHGDIDTQRQHCLRRPEHDGMAGTTEAIADCRDFILGKFDDAVEHGLASDGTVDRDALAAVTVHLAFRGQVQVEVPRFYLRMGQALHALQDGFSHTFRTPDQRQITVALNWIDVVASDHDEARDGPAHNRALDLCTGLDDLRQSRLALAVEASEALLSAALDPTLDLEARKLAGRTVLDEHLSVSPGCDASNRWCDAHELSYSTECGCRTPGTTSPSATPLSWLFLLSLLGVRRWRGAILALVTLSWPRPAEAHEPPPWESDEREGWGFHTSASAALDNGAFAYVIAGRYALTDRWLIGLDAEYNPWFSLEAGRVSTGAFNGYGTLIYRFPISRHFALRTTFHLGASVLLFDLVGAPAGSVGPFMGANLLGLSYEVADHWYLLLDPANVAWPVPQVKGAPFSYRQYRLTIGLQIGA